MDELEAAGASADEEAARLEAALAALKAARQREGNDALEQLEKDLHDAVTVDAKTAASTTSLEEATASEAKRQQQVLKSMKGDEKLLAAKEQQLAGGRDEFDAADARSKQLTEAVEAARKQYEAASMGMFVDEDGNATSLQQQAINAQTAAITAKTQVFKILNDWLYNLVFVAKMTRTTVYSTIVPRIFSSEQRLFEKIK